MPEVKCFCVPPGVFGLDGYCTKCRPVAGDVRMEPERDIVELPQWCKGVSYSAEHDVVIFTVLIPTDRGPVPVQLAAVPDDAEQVALAITRCVERSRRSVLDVPSSDDPPVH